MEHLRHLSLHVEEPAVGEFFWVLRESKQDISIWEEVSAALHAYPTWSEAWVHGSVEYMKHVSDRRFGRAQGEDEDANPVG